MRKLTTVLSTAVAATTVAATLLVPSFAGASSHREAPLISQDPAADLTDLYAFVSPDRPDTVTLIMNVNPFEAAYGGPNFFRFGDDVLYSINIDNDGDAVEDVVYQFRFRTTVENGNTFLYNTGPIDSLQDPDWNVRQVYDVSRTWLNDDGSSVTEVLGGSFPTPPVNIGPKSTPNYDFLAGLAVQDLPNGGKVFAGQRDDPFFVDLSALFDLLTIRQLPGNAGGGSDGLARFNVHTMALQIPIDELDSGDGIIGVWATTSRKQSRVLPGQENAGNVDEAFTQVSRLGHPLVNEVVVPVAFKDFFNASHPANDLANYGPSDAGYGPVVDPEVPKLLNLLYGISVPPAPRMDIVTVFLTGVPGLNQPANLTVPSEMLRLNMRIAPSAEENRMGVLGGDLAGFPNGRRPADDVTDAALRVMAGVLVEGYNIEPNNQLGDGVDVNDQPFMSTFPYISTSHSGYLVGNENIVQTGTP